MFRNFPPCIICYNLYLPRVKFNWSSPVLDHQGWPLVLDTDYFVVFFFTKYLYPRCPAFGRQVIIYHIYDTIHDSFMQVSYQFLPFGCLTAPMTHTHNLVFDKTFPIHIWMMRCIFMSDKSCHKNYLPILSNHMGWEQAWVLTNMPSQQHVLLSINNLTGQVLR